MRSVPFKVLVIVNKSDLDGDIRIKFHVIYVIRIWVDIRKMHIGKLTKCLTLIVIFQYHIARWLKLEIHTIGRSSAIHTGYKQEILQRES